MVVQWFENDEYRGDMPLVDFIDEIKTAGKRDWLVVVVGNNVFVGTGYRQFRYTLCEEY